jgi:hypothetical protein
MTLQAVPCLITDIAVQFLCRIVNTSNLNVLQTPQSCVKGTIHLDLSNEKGRFVSSAYFAQLSTFGYCEPAY